MVITAERLNCKCTQCGRPFSLFDKASIDDPPKKAICPTCERLIRLGLQEEK